MQMPSLSLKKELDKASTSYEKQMVSPGGLVADLYLRNRHITKETATYFRLGFVGEAEEGDEFEVGRLCIPYRTPSGIVGLKFRAIPQGGVPGNPEDSPKYKYRTGFQTTLYNTPDLFRNDTVTCICEGEIDTITAHQAGFPAVGVAGVKNWKPVFARAFRWKRVAILADNDDAGQGLEFAKEVQRSLSGSRIVLMPENHDVNSFYAEAGEERFRKLIVK